MASRDLTVRIDGDSSGFDRETRKAAASARALAGEAKKLEQQVAKQHQAMDQLGKAGMVAGGVIAAGIGVAVKKFADFDAGMSKVQAATHASAKSMQSLRDAAMEAGARTAFSATEAAEGIEALAKAGVATKDILNGGLNGALDLAAAGSLGVGEAAEIAATALTQFSLSGDKVPHVADLLAAAAGKAQGEVSDMGMALKQSGLVAAQTGLTIEETTTALASFASAGLLGSDAGTSLKTMLMTLTPKSVEAGEAMRDLGFSAFDSQGKFVGLQALAGEMKDSFRGLTDEQRQATMHTIFGSDAIRAASVLYDQGAAGIAKWTDKVDDAGYAQETAAIKLDNLKGDFEALGGSIETALIGAGSGANDVLRDLTQAATGAVNAFGALPNEVQQGATGIAAVTAAGLGLGGAFLYAVPKVSQFNDALQTMGPRTQAVGRGLGHVTSALAGPWGLALGAGVVALGFFAKAKADAKAEVDKFTQAIQADSGALGDNVRETAVAALEKEGLLKVAESLGLDLERVTDAVLGDARAMDDVAEATKQATGAGVGMEGQLSKQADGARRLDEAVRGLAGSTSEGLDAAKRSAEAIGEEGEAAKAAAGAAGELGAALDDAVAPTDGLTEAQQNLQKGLQSWADPLGTYQQLLKDKEAAERTTAEATAAATEDAKDSWEDYARDVDVSLDELSKSLEDDAKARDQWKQNLVKIAQTTGADVAQYITAMGEDGVDLAAKFANGTDAETKRLAAAIRTNIKQGADDATVALETQFRVMEAVARAGGKKTAFSLSQELKIGADEVARIAKQYGVNLSAGINPLLLSLGRNAVGGHRVAGQGSQGGVLERASGGPVWGAGTATSDSIPALLSNGEYVIKADSVNRYGHDFLDAVNQGAYAAGGLVKRFAAGGLATPPSTSPYRPPISTAGDSTMKHAYDAAMAYMAANTSSGGGPGSVAGDGELASNAVTAKKMVLSQLGFKGTIGGWGRRPNATEHDDMINGRKASRALDFMTTNRAIGDSIVALMDTFPGTKYQIWQRRIKNRGGAWRPYSGRSPHTDHVHTSFYNKGGPVGGRPIRRATGGPIRRATGGRVVHRTPDRSGRLPGDPAYGNDPTLLTRVSGMTDPAKIRATVQAWEDYNRILERNRGLIADLGQANHDLAMAHRGASADIAQAKREMATDLKLAKTKADRAEAYKKYDAVVKSGSEDITRALERQRDVQKSIKDSQMDDARDRERAAVDKLVESLEEEKKAREDLLSDLDRMLNDEKSARDKGIQAQEKYEERVTAIQKRSGEALAELRKQQAQLVADRRDQLSEWAALDEKQVVGWGNTVSQLLGNARDQAAQFEQWMASLAEARRRGVSEQVIASLGLDEGPEALGQLRQFGQATQAEIDALNAEVARRTVLASQQTDRERQIGQSDLARAMAEAHAEYVDKMADLNEELVQAQAELLADQAEVANELAAIGRDQARSYGQALSQGLRSQLPAVVAAAKALQAAVKGTNLAAPAVASNLPGGTSSPWRRRTYDSGGPLEPGYTLAYNGTGRTEFVVTSQQMAGAGGGITVNLYGDTFGVDQLHRTVRNGVQAALTEQRTASQVAGVRG